MSTPLSYTIVDIVGSPFLAVWRPEDDAVCAAGFLAVPDQTRDEPHPDVAADPLWDRLIASDPGLAARGLAQLPETAGAVPDALRAYADGDLTALDAITVSQRETPFRGEVWRALRKVQAGDAVTYTKLAALAGRPAAIRAAASGCATNLVAVIVPCHRIVRADGGVGKYLFGSAIKQRLLDHEGAIA
ncbi:methylated-DNA--[protein]-cysteine S-methyltransferase [Leucobacter aridicollis]|uniref:methylated-DNA--[protein]-cysteine S-methyltransferase n=1 Tax=Leucobacter aridicollis TaxID=283878 RepID=UPI002102BAE5|nr:methylated-DNA--[protein]-cysteine S-methyltransferase [Leucobacter aridicollis]UTX52534.1 methylated-DNA--[protein]-cysteine S-methyltransferase [Leucobacter aridicollis]